MEAKIKLTKTMLNKSIIDANKSVREFLEQELDYAYDKLEADVDGKYYSKYWCHALYEDDTPTIVTFYKSQTRGDRRISNKEKPLPPDDPHDDWGNQPIPKEKQYA